MKTRKIGMVGCGVMGRDIAQLAATVGFDVVMFARRESSLDKAMAEIKTSLNRMEQKGKLQAGEANEILSRFKTSTDLSAMAGVDLVIESVPENLELKKQVFSELEKICSPETIFSTDTSSLSINEIGSFTKRPDKFIGFHFVSPAHLTKLVEVIPSEDTNEAVLTECLEVAKKMRKEAVVVKDSCLFVLDRLIVPFVNEAIFMLESGIASAEDIDKVLVLGANHPLGPLGIADMAGLDTMLTIMETLVQETGDPKYRPCPLLRRMVRAGHLGRKTGKGFFDYTN